MGEIFGEKRVAAYARVSLETDRLAHSLSAQTEHYRDFIGARLGWELAGVYADSFISGTETSRRADFNRLISDCEQGRVDVVLCKSISRFARNTVDLLKTVRHLKELGIEVYFEKERLSSLSSDGELVMTILASFAQEESRSISENVKWGIRKRFKAGTAGIRNKRVLGYRCDGAKYVVVPEEAELVRRIFADYIDKVSLRKIAERLRKSGFKTTRGLDFSPGEINYIVRNELYIGNIVLQKTFVKDFITHTKVKNRGELPIYRF
ncbi:MAG: recombinase family protein, partial [Oscillospiraceae bacterium]|nr:recombinase family protein [Oscillospiraceae bacterium]